ncbi:hypothetical protein T440DRAFT_482198 [Plenodomus tracheiphilus IPT5]|uniref:SAE2-domain-containing protein n=1 Tax=Plenodomus tracheiphilus IPT5 TaxID=1408161 RepID=A0A6A7AUJ6_9PLEO|nr:hypothetical protein T440DRAFT_482198 [Plenodomus tracheiphilus IPT5]
MAPKKKKTTAKSKTKIATAAGIKTGRVIKAAPRTTSARAAAAAPLATLRRSSRVAAAKAAAEAAKVDVPAAVPKKGRSKKVTPNSNQGGPKKVTFDSAANVDANNTPAAVPKKGRAKKAAATVAPVIDSADATAPVSRRTRSQTAANSTANATPVAVPAETSKSSKSKKSAPEAAKASRVKKRTAKTAPVSQPPLASIPEDNEQFSAAADQQDANGDEPIREQREEQENGDQLEDLVPTSLSPSANEQQTGDREPGHDQFEAREGEDQLQDSAQTVSTPSANGQDADENLPFHEQREVREEEDQLEDSTPTTPTPSANSLGKRPQNPFWSTGEGPLHKRARLERQTPEPPFARWLEVTPSSEHVPIPCVHPRHPAYANTLDYTHTRCPHCRMDECINDVQIVQDQLVTKEGSVEFREKSEGSSYAMSRLYRPLVMGFNNGSRVHWAIQEPAGKDLSYRHATKRLANLVMQLEGLSVKEKQWRRQHPAEPRAMDEDTHEAQLYSATSALTRYRSLLEAGSFNRLLERDFVAARKRGRDSEVEALDFHDEANDAAVAWQTQYLRPDRTSAPDDPEMPDGWVSHNADVPPVEKTDSIAAEKLEQPTRKRRRMDATVTWNNDVHVRTENDIDVLREADLSRPAVLPSASILRTGLSSGAVHSGPNVPMVEPEHEVLPLKDMDGPVHSRLQLTRNNGVRSESRWGDRPERGKYIINTSGHGVQPDTWARYIEAQQMEAKAWDTMNAQDAQIHAKEQEKAGVASLQPWSRPKTPARPRFFSLLTGEEVIDQEAYLAEEEERVAKLRKRHSKHTERPT